MSVGVRATGVCQGGGGFGSKLKVQGIVSA